MMNPQTPGTELDECFPALCTGAPGCEHYECAVERTFDALYIYVAAAQGMRRMASDGAEWSRYDTDQRDMGATARDLYTMAFPYPA